MVKWEMGNGGSRSRGGVCVLANMHAIKWDWENIEIPVEFEFTCSTRVPEPMLQYPSPSN